MSEIDSSVNEKKKDNSDLEQQIFGASDDEDLSDFETLGVELSDDDEEPFTSPKGPSSPRAALTHHSEQVSTPSRGTSLPKKPDIQSSSKKRKAIEEDLDSRKVQVDEYDPKEALREQVRKDFDEALASMKPRRKKKEIDEAEIDELIIQLRERMKDAAIEDVENNKSKRPAFAKLKMLPTVSEQLIQTHLFEQLLDNHILEAVKMWLEPLPDGSLPGFDVRKEMLELLNNLPIQIVHLRESGIGRVVKFYQICKRETPKLRKLAYNLIEKWSRPLLNRSDDYRDRYIPEVDFTGREHEHSNISNKDEANVGLEVLSSSRAQNGDDPQTRRNIIPRKIQPAYTVVPKSTLLSEEKRSKNASQKYSRIKAHLTKIKRSKT